MHYWWVPCVCILSALLAYASFRHNATGEARDFVVVAIINAIPLWAMVSRYSRNLIFDGLLYDVLLFSAFPLTLALLGAGKAFSFTNWLGCVVVLAGFLLMRA